MNKIRELRKLHNLNQAQLAQICNTSISNVSGWELEKWQPSNDDLITLANYFNVSIDYLLNRTDSDITFEERAAGATSTKKINITPIEDEMLYFFREIGKKHGEAAQRALITVAEKML